jgi:alkanesulfonate monooxygenase SsuD/methylene tetrahydromethanopterin reductase-like flavin-dependent oxidoreductase (luciferase family)
MRFAVNIPNFGAFGDPRAVADLARRAEEAGWDAVFVWDHVTWVKNRHRQIADEYGSFGDTTDLRKLATRLDEGLLF